MATPWPDLDTTDLRLLVEVRRTGSISAAAGVLGMSQPAASARLSTLERRLGATLLERTTRGARLTWAGNAVQARAVRVLDLLAAAKLDAHHAAGRQPLTLGAPASLAPSLAVLAAATLNPATTVTWRSAHTVELLDQVLDTTIDAAFITGQHVPEGLTAQHLWDEPIHLTVHPDHPLTERARVGLADLAQHPVALHAWGPAASDLANSLGPSARVTTVSPAAAAVALALSADHVSITLAMATDAEVRTGRLIRLRPAGVEFGDVTVTVSYRTDRAHQPLITGLTKLARSPHGK